jgi:apolipoprotein N-acyltransferase
MVISFPFTGSLTPLVFISWIPLLCIEYFVSKQKYRSSKVYLHAFITFFIYNLGTTWWIWNASPEGAIFAIVLNALIMAFVFYFFHKIKKNHSEKIGYLVLILIWISFEYIHFHWELSWPWLNFGNVFSITPSIVQWYSITGILGGTLWILLINIISFFIIRNIFIKTQKWHTQKTNLLIVGGVLIIPIVISLISYYSYEEVKNPIEVISIQPNIDPYNEKFNTEMKGQLDKIFYQADSKVTSKTKFILAPETAISATFFEEDLSSLPFFNYIIQRKKKWGDAAFYTGASTLCFFKEKHSTASRKIDGGPGFIESYNTSLLINKYDSTFFVHKSKLVLGVEKIPFLTVLPWLEELAINLDGASGSLGVEIEPKVLQANNLIFAPSICYESIYGEFISHQVKKGAEMIFVITNDGWWGDTPGYKQHASFSRLRAIENRRSLARSANTGISCFINQRGDVSQQTSWWKEASIRGNLNKNSELTFYSTHGDFIGKLFSFILVFILGFELVKSVVKIISKYK